MSNEHETVADIVAEMRKRPPEGDETPAGLACSLFADRIEAAHKREEVELREALKSICDYAGCCCVARGFDHDHMVELVMRGHAALKAKEGNK